MLYSYKGAYPSSLPFRIRLQNGMTRTDPSTFTEEELSELGYIIVEEAPTINSDQVLEWNSEDIMWIVRQKTPEELQAELNDKWNSIRSHRDSLMKDFEWRISRYYRQTRLNITPIDDIQELDDYMQALADITLQQDPDNIIWPTLP